MKIFRLAALAAHASALFGAYQYYQSDTFSSLNSTNWWVIGGAVATSQGLSANGNAALISNVPIPDGSWDYEVKITLNLADNSHGDLLPVIYLRDQGNPSIAPLTGTMPSKSTPRRLQARVPIRYTSITRTRAASTTSSSLREAAVAIMGRRFGPLSTAPRA